jgi:WD40 repeat protein
MRGGARELTSAGFSTDGHRFVVGGWDGVIRVWATDGGPPVSILRGQRSRVYDVGFGAKGDRVVSAGDDGTARTWDAGRVQSWVSPPLTDNLDFNRDGRLIVSASEDGTPRVWDAATGQLRKTMPGARGFTTARFSPVANDVLVGRYAESSVTLWPLSADAPEGIVQLPKGRGIYLARFDRKGEHIVYADTKGRIAVRDLRSQHEVVLGGAPKDVYDARISPDGSHVAAVTESGKLMLWRLDRPAHPERVFTGHRGHVNTVAYSDDGQRIVTSGADRTVRVWDPRSGSSVVLRGHGDEVTTAIFTHEGRVLSTSADGTLRLWDARGGDALAVLESGEGPLYDVVVSPDGHIATLGETNIRISSCDVCGSFERVRALARSRAPRPLTPDERRRFLPPQR